jgi:hypothetical protein
MRVPLSRHARLSGNWLGGHDRRGSSYGGIEARSPWCRARLHQSLRHRDTHVAADLWGKRARSSCFFGSTAEGACLWGRLYRRPRGSFPWFGIPAVLVVVPCPQGRQPIPRPCSPQPHGRPRSAPLASRHRHPGWCCPTVPCRGRCEPPRSRVWPLPDARTPSARVGRRRRRRSRW